MGLFNLGFSPPRLWIDRGVRFCNHMTETFAIGRNDLAYEVITGIVGPQARPIDAQFVAVLRVIYADARWTRWVPGTRPWDFGGMWIPSCLHGNFSDMITSAQGVAFDYTAHADAVMLWVTGLTNELDNLSNQFSNRNGGVGPGGRRVRRIPEPNPAFITSFCSEWAEGMVKYFRYPCVPSAEPQRVLELVSLDPMGAYSLYYRGTASGEQTTSYGVAYAQRLVASATDFPPVDYKTEQVILALELMGHAIHATYDMPGGGGIPEDVFVDAAFRVWESKYKAKAGDKILFSLVYQVYKRRTPYADDYNGFFDDTRRTLQAVEPAWDNSFIAAATILWFRRPVVNIPIGAVAVAAVRPKMMVPTSPQGPLPLSIMLYRGLAVSSVGEAVEKVAGRALGVDYPVSMGANLVVDCRTFWDGVVNYIDEKAVVPKLDEVKLEEVIDAMNVRQTKAKTFKLPYVKSSVVRVDKKLQVGPINYRSLLVLPDPEVLAYYVENTLIGEAGTGTVGSALHSISDTLQLQYVQLIVHDIQIPELEMAGTFKIPSLRVVEDYSS
jgi:hypothetical protein